MVGCMVTFDKLSKTLPGGAIMKCQTCLAFFFHTEAGWLHFGEWKAEVLVQVIQLIDEVSYITPQHLNQTKTGAVIK